ncbi:hypothetical protein [Ferrimonas sp. YFM]|uniref:hypothetical protein n=1 Tax=Ferrimonas sp. YFM TaxID=3028878 RepID=UPI0025730F3C|nr:hypothetical protein [Ferrimonas sp. YFM]BDY05086.1 hypothetical protein F0521_21270 [Ferrimonas sp. YFM]
MKKVLSAVLGLVIANASFASCDIEYAKQAMKEHDAMYKAYRFHLVGVSQYTDKLFYERTPVNKIYDSPEGFSKAIVVNGFVVELMASSSIHSMEGCFQEIEMYTARMKEYKRDSAILSKILSHTYEQCADSGDSQFKKELKKHYDRRESYQDFHDHMVNERIANLKKLCSDEYAFTSKAIELSKVCSKRKSNDAMDRIDRIEQQYIGYLTEVETYYKTNYIDANPYHRYFDSTGKMVDYLNKYGKAAKQGVEKVMMEAQACYQGADDKIMEMNESSKILTKVAYQDISENYNYCSETDPEFAKKLKGYLDKKQAFFEFEKTLEKERLEKIGLLCKKEVNFISESLKMHSGK